MYSDATADTEEVTRCFALIHRLLPIVENAVHTGRLRRTDRLVIAASGFYGGHWIKAGETHKQEFRSSDRPHSILAAALAWLEDPTTP